ncbi:MAG: sugar transferase [Anaerolineae bacterium]
MSRKPVVLNPALMAVTDAVLINVAFLVSYVVRYELQIPYPVLPQYDAPFWPYIPFAALLTVLCLLSYRIDGLYEFRRRRRWLDELYRLITGTMTSIVIIMAITFFLQPLVYSRGMLVLAAMLIILFLSAARLIINAIILQQRKRGIGVDRVLIVGMGELGRSVVRNILGDPMIGYQIAGYVDDDPAKGSGKLGRIKGLGGLDRLAEIIDQHHVDEVIVTLPWMYHRKILQIIAECERGNVRVRVVPDVFQQRMRHVDLDTLNGIPLIGAGPDKLGPSAAFLKRTLDLTLALLALPFFALIYLIVAPLIKLDSPGPVIYKHRRIGKDGRPIAIYKFRSMVEDADKMQAELAALNEADGPLFKIKDDPRLTRVGKVLRRTSIDELPQLINILRGEMSWVGPRPGTPEEVTQYEPWQAKRLSIKPGLTGLWQISGRSDVPFDEMCLLDIFYIENWSLDLDIRILLQTIPLVLSGKGAY